MGLSWPLLLPLGLSWAVLGVSWGSPGTLLGLSWPLLASPGSLLASLAPLMSSQELSGVCLVALLGLSGFPVGFSWVSVGPNFRHILCYLLGPFFGLVC